MDSEDPTAQDVIDAMRLVLVAQRQPDEAMKLVDMLLDFAPPTETNRGVELILNLIAETSLRVEVVGS